MNAGAAPQAQNRRTGWLLLGIFMALFVGSILYVSVYH